MQREETVLNGRSFHFCPKVSQLKKVTWILIIIPIYIHSHAFLANLLFKDDLAQFK